MTQSNLTQPIRVLLADDHEVVRIGLRTLLSRYNNIQIVGETATAADTVAEASRTKPDVVLLDVRLPQGDGFDACRQILGTSTGAHVLFLTSFADDDTIFEAIAAGADGFLLKEVSGEELVRAIEQVASGQSILDPAVTRRVMGRVKQGGEPAGQNKMDMLSAQERRVVALVAEGKTNKEIAVSLGLSDKTIKNYLSNVLEKLKLSRRSQVAAFYVQNSRQ
ncbi:MAG: response regulator transcription factor [Verrucomicrobiota bacterium]